MLNTVTLMGRLVDDPKIYAGDENKKYLATFTLAVNAGEDNAYFFDCKVFGQDATTTYLAKGDLIGISGKLTQEKFQRKNGSNGSAVVIVVNSIEFADVVGTPAEEPEPEQEPAKPSNPVANNTRRR